MNPISSSDQIFVIKESFYKKLSKPLTSVISAAKKRFSTKTEENRGFFYKIQDPQGKTAGYLLGTIHVMDKEWPGLSARMKEKISKSSKVLFENLVGFEEESKEGLMKNFSATFTLGVDYAVYDSAQEQAKEIEAFETSEEANWIISSLGLFFPKELIFPKGKEVMKTAQNWKKGIRENFSDEYRLIIKEKDVHKKDSYITGVNFVGAKRNHAWIDKLDKELRSTNGESKIFVAVGANHLWDLREFDLPPPVKFQCKGLITLLEERGWTVIDAN